LRVLERSVRGSSTLATLPDEGVLVTVRLCLLGGFELRAKGEIVDLPTNSRRVLAFLALRERAVTRVYLAGNLWPDATEVRSLANLRTAIWSLNAPSSAIVVVSPRLLRVADGVRIDVREAMRAAQAAIDRPAGDAFVRQFGEAGELLPDWYEDWVDAERERMRQLQLNALEAVAAKALEDGRYAYAADACLLAIHLDALRESSQRLLLRVHLAQGNLKDARRLYLDYEARLQTEYGLRPSVAMRELAATQSLTRS
jgi:DNA-binding SARP family transcriptional activator